MEEKIIQKLIDHDEQLQFIRENMATSNDVRNMTGILEGIATITQKIQEDHTFGIEWIKRLQTPVERQEEDIRKIKMQLQIA
ncbi:hypothetical protein HZA86_04295 [Candidatus Uhrbacteria bacterium]|nr:hypothetical protein [Candidatus Uhrbacteria bacterium]